MMHRRGKGRLNKRRHAPWTDPETPGSGHLAAHFLDRALDQDLGVVAVDLVGQQAPGGANRERCGLTAYVLNRPGLFLRDPTERLLGAPGEAGLELGAVALGLALGFAVRMLADAACVLLAGGQLAFVLGEQALRLITQTPGLVQLGPNLARMAVERADDRPADRLPDPGDQDRQGDQQPDFQHQAASARTSRSAASAAFLVTFSPASCSAAAWATVTAELRSSLSAARLASAI